MKADLIFDSVEFLGATDKQVVRVRVGETFRVNLKDVVAALSVDWFLDYDQTFEVMVAADGKSATLKALAVGPSTLQLQVSEKIEMRLKFEVFSAEATHLEHPNPASIELLS